MGNLKLFLQRSCGLKIRLLIQLLAKKKQNFLKSSKFLVFVTIQIKNNYNLLISYKNIN